MCYSALYFPDWSFLNQWFGISRGILCCTLLYILGAREYDVDSLGSSPITDGRTVFFFFFFLMVRVVTPARWRGFIPETIVGDLAGALFRLSLRSHDAARCYVTVCRKPSPIGTVLKATSSPLSPALSRGSDLDQTYARSSRRQDSLLSRDFKYSVSCFASSQHSLALVVLIFNIRYNAFTDLSATI